MTSEEIRQQFLDFFASKDHAIVESSPVVPLDDPTLMFTNAGMNQFKDVFLETGTRPYTRAADTQKCIRAGGKHNDLDDVGQDTYHHTFFEMLGNWSFGDYFKKEAIAWAWELLTGVWGVDGTRLHATYFQGDEAEGLEPDLEAAKLWKSETSIDPEHVHPGSKKDNFWEMGETGPCGPCSEIHIDLTPDKSGAALVNAGDPRVIEIWNLVFIQFNRAAGGTLTPLPAKHVDTGMGFERLCAVLNGKTSNYDTDVWTPIIDAIQKRTGAPAYAGTVPGAVRNRDSHGAVRDQDRPSDPGTLPGQNPPQPPLGKGGSSTPRPPLDKGETSTPQPPVAKGESGSASPPLAKGESGSASPPLAKGGLGGVDPQTMIDVSYRVIADHVRCLTFALTDGAVPSNEGRGYVLRRILRRAVRYGRQYLNMHEPFMCDLVAPLVEHMGDVFPELRTTHGGRNVAHVTELIRDEEESFGKTLDRGIRLFNEAADFAVKHHHGRISGEDAFKLHDTYGFPIDLTELMAEEQGLTIDFAEYERLMEEARITARQSLQRQVDGAWDSIRESLSSLEGPDRQGLALGLGTRFTGYDELETNTRIVATVWWRSETQRANVGQPIEEGQHGAVILEKTPFYAESGGQVGDTGAILQGDNRFVVERVERTVAFSVALSPHSAGESFHGHIVHYGRTERGSVKPGAECRARVSTRTRRPAMKNHTSTHMLNWALREVLGDHIQQKGSLVDPEKTRFDFSHNKPASDEELTQVEQLVNERIEADQPVHTQVVNQKKALAINTLRAVFGEKYPDEVRVVSIGADIAAMVADPKNPEWMKYPVEFCGGTHLRRSSEAQRFALVSEEGVAKGVRRVVGITGEAARQAEAAGEKLLAKARDFAESLSQRLGEPRVSPAEFEPRASAAEFEPRAPAAGFEPRASAAGFEPRASARAEPPGSVAGTGSNALDGERLSAFQQEVNEATIPVRIRHELAGKLTDLQKALRKQERRVAADAGSAVMDRVGELLSQASRVQDVAVVVGEVPAAPPEALRRAIDWVRNKTEASAALLATSADGKVTLIAGMSKKVVGKGVKAGDLIKEVAPLVGGRGGGRPDMAQGGGNDPSGIPAALDRAREWIGEKLR